jgi:Tfp pilus assembly protein PilX
MSRLLALLRRHDDDRGVALAAVLGIGMVVMILAATMVGISTSGAVKTTSDRDYANAMAAAYAGLADYQSRVNADNTYATKYGDATQPFSSGDTFANKTGGNPAFSSWVTVPDSNGASGSTSYRYAVDNSIYGQQGIVRVQVTGRAGKSTRTLVANVKPDGFSNYLYWTDYESGDPDITGENCNNVYQNANFSAPPIGGKPVCGRIQFQDGDVLNGPIRSNDVMLVCGGTFMKTVQSAVGTTDSGCSPKRTPSYQYYDGYQPEVVGSYTPPSTISAGRDRMYSDDPTVSGTTPGTGCLYTGPTQITFTGNGTMKVRSPLTLATNLQKTSPYGSAPAKCGAISDLQGAGATVSTSLLANNLIYVQDEPATAGSGSSTNPNYYWSKYTARTAPSACMRSSSVTDNGLGFPYTGRAAGYSGTYMEATPRNAQGDSVPFSKAYGCSNGDLFVSGKVDASITLVAENYVYVTGDLQYTATRAASTVLGIVGQEAVLVWNPMFDRVTSLFGSATVTPFLADDRTVSGAILSNQGTFTVQNYAYGGERGTLTLNGSIAQRYRGAVGKGSNGYLKGYGYDTSLGSYTPPFFPQPVITTYKVTSQIEVKAAYDANGTPR